MLFSDVISHSAVRQQIIRLAQSGRVPHAMLFLGPEGCGNLAMAVAFARYILCTNKGEQGSCGVCPSCSKINKLAHPDLHFSYPVIARKKEDRQPKSSDWIQEWRENFLANPYLNVQQWLETLSPEKKQGNISATECHDILRRLSLKAFEGAYKILIIWMPEYLGGSGNILLKLMEEPPDHTIIILAAVNRDQILNTILSRMQIIQFLRPPDETISAALRTLHGLPAGEADRIAYLADGNYNEALQLKAGGEHDAFPTLREWLNLCFTRNTARMVSWSDKMAALPREEQKNFIRYALNILRESILHRSGSPALIRAGENEHNLAGKLARHLPAEGTAIMAEKLEKAHYYLERNANPRILFMNLSLLLSGKLGKARQPVREKH